MQTGPECLAYEGGTLTGGQGLQERDGVVILAVMETDGDTLVRRIAVRTLAPVSIVSHPHLHSLADGRADDDGPAADRQGSQVLDEVIIFAMAKTDG